MKNQNVVLSMIVMIVAFAIVSVHLMQKSLDKEARVIDEAKIRSKGKKPKKWCLRVEQYTPGGSWAIAYSSDDFKTYEFLTEKYMSFPFTGIYLARTEKQAIDWAEKYKNPRRLVRHNREMFKIDSLFESNMDKEEAEDLAKWKDFEAKKTIIDCK